MLVVDDEPAMREVLQARIERWGFPVRTAESVQAARVLTGSFDPHLVISDLVLPDATGLALLEHLRGEARERTILMITAYGTIDMAVQAIKGGAADFLTKPLDYVALHRFIAEIEDRLRASSQAPTQAQAQAQTTEFEAPAPALDGMVGASDALLRMQARVRAAASSDAPVLIVGESGSGKELVARSLHRLSGARAPGPFVPVNAAAIPEALAEGELFGVERGAFTGATSARMGLFEHADGGTLFLDEITEMPLALQAKLLRVLEDGNIRRVGARAQTRCDVRLIAATNRDPAAAVENGRMRQDLLYRLDVLRIDVPPLRERREDLPALVAHFVRDCAQRYAAPAPRIEPGALAVLHGHDWPGNIRELRNVIERAFTRAHRGMISAAELDLDGVGIELRAELPRGIVLPHGVTAADAERIVILETLKTTGNNKAEAARRLGLDVKTIRNKLKTFEGEGSAT
ncbi:Response regulator of zinc sigma-54-dependent two-component system [Enhygromyxa salina]|uniref:Response regulator of zinc sigma-54-dependent two-component system n=1 Tax=Enhygromyxa salina TaxID=215803 RepID=A0A0C1ZU85_9BACT|nr:Response regulator of zinc sigma-54-dependent two-component system [Enhygromyxa salina]